MANKFFYVCAGLLCLAVAYHLGARSAGAQAPDPSGGEVAVLSGSIGSGEYIPLPSYRDGTQALESECRWIVSLQSTITEAGGQLFCYTDGLRVFCGTNNRQSPANYLIIAVRSPAAPTSVQRESFGGLKVRYR